MPTLNFLYRKEYKINDHIIVRIPTVEEVLEDEDSYYGIVSSFVSTPFDMMVALDDAGIDPNSINDYELFVLLFSSMKDQDTSRILKDIKLSEFQMMVNPQNNTLVFRNSQGAIIDRGIHAQIATTLRKIHHMKRNYRRAGNKEAQDYLLERERRRRSNRSRRLQDSQLEQSILALVNTKEFSYNFETVLGLTIYQFNESLLQINRKIEYDNLMRGVYAGTIDAKKLGQDALTWLGPVDGDKR